MIMALQLKQAPTSEPGRLPSPAVVGLDAGRDHARVLQRRRRRRDRVRNVLYVLLGLAVLGGVGYGAFIAYGDFEDDEEQERQEIRAELDANRVSTGDNVRDALDELEQQPQFNGPGVPALGVGDEP